VLLDTHAFLWFIMGSDRLSVPVRAVIEDAGNQKLVSMASLWEMSIKVSLGRLALAEPFDVLIPAQIHDSGFEILPILLEHVTAVSNLPMHHGDPFDRMLIAQGLVGRMPIVTVDAAFKGYPVQTLW
jgi:PIN domain nuclease of toxin-antitoxin system